MDRPAAAVPCREPRLVVVGRPSSALSDKLKADTKALEEERRKKLGEDGLKRLEAQLEAAKKENDRPIPDEMLKQFKIPSTDSIKWIPVGTAQVQPIASASDKPSKTTAYGLQVENTRDELDQKIQAHVDADSASLPYFVQFDHVSSAFVSISLVFATTDLPKELRAQMQLYLSVLFSLPLVRQDATKASLTYEEVVKGWTRTRSSTTSRSAAAGSASLSAPNSSSSVPTTKGHRMAS